MAQVQELKAEAREGRGKGPAYQARLKGKIPGVVYGGEAQPETVNVDGRTLERHIEKGAFLTTLLMLDVNGKKTRVIPRQLQLDPVSDRPVHVDFMRLAEGATVRLDIPVHFKGQGESPGLKKGGVLNVVRHEMELILSADRIPNEIVVDVSKLDINESIHISALTLPEGAKPTIRERDFTICSIVAPTSVAVCSISTTAPMRMRDSLSQPSALAASSSIMGRIRLPPPAMRYVAISVTTRTEESD